jgi:toxin ParE1/3/4
MAVIHWSSAALEELEALMDYVGERNPEAGRMLYAQIEASVLPLASWPYLFKKGRIEGTREIVAHPNYIVVYRVLDDAVIITSVIHARRQYP